MNETTGQTSRGVLLFSMVAMILPLVAFPARFGTELARPALVNALYELVYYGVVLFVFHRRTTLLKLIEGAGVCLIYRLAIGAVFGLLIAAMYSMNVRVSLSMGMSGYLPAILFQIVLAPFILKPALAKLVSSEESERRTAPPPRPPDTVEVGRTSIAVSKQRGVVTDDSAPVQAIREIVQDTLGPEANATISKQSSTQDRNGFDRAVAYIAEHGSVKAAAVVDLEGLLLANFTRGEIEPEDLAPQAMRLFDTNQEVLDNCRLDGLARLDMQMEAERLVVVRSKGYCLVVLSDRRDDDLLSIRINQGIEMINRFIAERYGDKLNSNAERIHVSSAQ